MSSNFSFNVNSENIILKKKLIPSNVVSLFKNKSNFFSRYVAFPFGMVLSSVLIFLLD